MTEQYPFFRDEDERTLAAIGEEAVASDLGGTYQKPYAVLTQKRLYCKNELGNFITGYDKILHARRQKSAPQWLLWVPFGFDILSTLISAANLIPILLSSDYYTSDFPMLVLPAIFLLVSCACVILFLIFRKTWPKAAPIMLCIPAILSSLSGLLVIPFVVIYYAMGGGNGEWFEICHTTGSFTFSTKLYPAAEFKNFEAQVKVLTGKANGK